MNDMKSTLGYYFSFGSSMFSWCSRKQDVVAQSTANAKYITATVTVNQAIWIREILVDLHKDQLESTHIYVDNQAIISIANNPVFHCRTKHFKIKLYFLKEV
jgi:N-acetylmuramoyl-L-alanine amidase CwlA